MVVPEASRATLVGMGLRLYQLVVDSHDPEMLGRWWATVLGYDVLFDAPGEAIIGTDPAGIRESALCLSGTRKVSRTDWTSTLTPTTTMRRSPE